jgi:shikimate kinase
MMGAMSASDRPLTSLPPERIFLVGLMGSGKTTIGRRLSRAIGWPYLDNDALVVETTGQDARTLSTVAGEADLHAAEMAAFELAAWTEPPVIVGVAGFVVMDVRARERMHAAGNVVWLRAEPETLHQRTGSGDGRRPDATSLEWIARTATERAPIFEQAADLIVDVDLRREREIVALIVKTFGLTRAG